MKTFEKYSVHACAPGVITEAELSACLELVKNGGAVAISLEKLRNARLLAVARSDGVIVGVGSIKRNRPEPAADVAQRSGFSFSNEIPELGYVAVDQQHTPVHVGGLKTSIQS